MDFLYMMEAVASVFLEKESKVYLSKDFLKRKCMTSLVLHSSPKSSGWSKYKEKN